MTRYALPAAILLVIGGLVYTARPATDASSGQAPDPQSDKALADNGTFTNSIGMKFVAIKPGEFLMGSPANQRGHCSNETQHKVKLTNGFYMGATLVTQDQWTAVMRNNPSQFKGGDLPVDRASWNDAMTFCQILTEKEGRQYRLPTEAEWEYACRAGTQTAYSFGDDPAQLVNYAWHSENSDSHTHPENQKKANAWGLFDMQGNLLEWCADFYGPYPAWDVVNPTGPNSGNNNTPRILRGGSWYSGPRYCRCASREWSSQDIQDDHLGFRCVLDVQ